MRGWPAVPSATSLIVCVPDSSVHDRAATTFRGVQLERCRFTVDTYLPSTYSFALPRLAPFGATIPTALPVNRKLTEAPLRVA